VPHDTRDAVVDFVHRWSARTGIPACRFVRWLQMASSKFYGWRTRYGKVNEHNGLVPRDFWLEEWEKRAIVEFHRQYPLEGYRRLAFMMLDRDVVAASPSSVYRVLRDAGLLRKWNRKVSRKGTGFVQPLRPHEHWHVDISYINICGTFYYLESTSFPGPDVRRQGGFPRSWIGLSGGVGISRGLRSSRRLRENLVVCFQVQWR